MCSPSFNLLTQYNLVVSIYAQFIYYKKDKFPQLINTESNLLFIELK